MEEDMTMKKQTQTSITMPPNSTSTSTCRISSSSGYNNPPPMHKNSRTISKPKPRIRIIHIFAPEIIKTDAANFRELVQRLTGKPTAGDKTKRAVKEELENNDFQMWNHKNNNSFGGGFLGGFADLDVGFNVHEFGFLPPHSHAMHVFDQEPQLIT